MAWLWRLGRPTLSELQVPYGLVDDGGRESVGEMGLW